MNFARNERLESDLLDRFCRYVQIDTTSDRQSETKPTSPRQWDLLHLLEAELKTLGLTDVHTDPRGYTLGRLPASPGKEAAPSVALLAHVDTSPDAPGGPVKPIVHRNYDGQPIKLPAGLVLDPKDNPVLRRYIGQTVITSDGSTLLGADDKAGVAEIMAAVTWLVAHPELPRPALEIIFTTDEEVGRGTENFPFDKLQSRFAYTLDGSEEGGVESECYYAHRAFVTFNGISHHPGTARGKLVNAVTMVGLFLTLLPRSESPEATDGRFGCVWANDVQGGIEKATLEVYVRDFDLKQSERRLSSLRAYADAVEAAFPGGKITIETSVQYRNMKDKLDEHPLVLKNLLEAVRRTGLEPFSEAIRGGTDGARLTELGLPTPNLFTGGMNYHSRTEWAALPAMVRASQTVIELAALWADHSGPT
jgi:tripeptide aminopeptidase